MKEERGVMQLSRYKITLLFLKKGNEEESFPRNSRMNT